MKQAAITGVRQAAAIEVAMPRSVKHWALVKVHTAPLCTEFKGYVAGHAGHALGHEACGEVVEVAQPGRVKVGDRVVVMPMLACGACSCCLSGDYIHCQQQADYKAFTGGQEFTGTMTQYLLKPDWLLPILPTGMSFDHGAMACCGFGPTFGAMQRLAVDAFDTLLITGLGPVGLGGIINARFRGCRVLGVEGNAYRAKLALELGAEAVLDPADSGTLSRLRELTGGQGVDKAIDCAGTGSSRRLCLDATRRLGQVAIVGEGAEVPIDGSNHMIRKGLTVHGCWHFRMGDMPRLMQVIQRSGPAIERLITHRFPMDRIAAAFELQTTGQCGKVLLKPWE
jgi:threonine dehydrogenase-like Zn-dependent dehydrogenase